VVKLLHHSVDLHVLLKDMVMHEVVVQVVDTVMEATLQVTEEDLLHGARKAASKVKSNLVMGTLTSQKHLLTGGQNILLQKAMFITTTQKLVYRSGNDHLKCNNCRSCDVIVSALLLLRNLPR
jgi:hypothetical protein